MSSIFQLILYFIYITNACKRNAGDVGAIEYTEYKRNDAIKLNGLRQ